MGNVRVAGVGKVFGSVGVLKDVSFNLKGGELVGLVGPSGGGKSVLLKILGKVLDPSWGSVTHHRSDSPERAGEVRSEALSVGFLFQEGALFDSMSVLENVSFPLLSQPIAIRPDAKSTPASTEAVASGQKFMCGRAEAYERAMEILSEVGLAKAAEKLPGQLSGGMRRRVGIARALVNQPDLVLLDDPTGGLDPVAARVIIDLIVELHHRYNPTVVLVSHDIRRLLPSVKRVLGLFNGEIVCDVAPHDLRSLAPEGVVSFLATRFDFDAFESQPRVL